METVTYELKSIPETSVEVPADYAKDAEDLVELAIKKLYTKKSDDLDSALRPFDSSPIRIRALSLADDPESLVSQDLLYLDVCVYECEHTVGDGRADALKMRDPLIDIITKLLILENATRE